MFRYALDKGEKKIPLNFPFKVVIGIPPDSLESWKDCARQTLEATVRRSEESLVDPWHDLWFPNEMDALSATTKKRIAAMIRPIAQAMAVEESSLHEPPRKKRRLEEKPKSEEGERGEAMDEDERGEAMDEDQD